MKSSNGGLTSHVEYSTYSPDKVTVDLTTEKPAFRPGGVLRCNVEVQAPKNGAKKVALDYITLQFYGTLISSHPTVKKLRASSNVSSSAILALGPFLRPDSKLLMASDPCIVCSDVSFAEPSDTYCYGFECRIPPCLPPTFIGSTAKYVYHLLMVVQKRQTTGGGLQPTTIRMRIPVFLVAPRSGIEMELHMPIMETLGHPIVTDPNSVCNAAARKLARKNPLALDLGPVTTNISSDLGRFWAKMAEEENNAPDWIAQADGLPFLKTFNFQPYAWLGGSYHSQISLLNELPVGKGLMPSLSSAEPVSSVEMELAIINATGGAKCSQRKLEDMIKFQNPAQPRALVKRSASLPLLSDIDPASAPQTNEGVLAPEVFCDDEEEHLRLQKRRFRICKDGLEVCVLGLWCRSNEVGTFCMANVGSCVSIDLFTGGALVTVYEVYVTILREETPITNSLDKSQVQPKTHGHVVAEHRQCLLNQKSSLVQLHIPSNAVPSFETDVVSVEYSLVFRFYCSAKDESKIVESGAQRMPKKNLMRLSWLHKLRVLPPPYMETGIGGEEDGGDILAQSGDSSCTQARELSATSRILYSLAGNTAIIGERCRRMHKECFI